MEMSTFVDVLRSGKAPLWWMGAAFLSALFLAAVCIPSLRESRTAAGHSRAVTQLQEVAKEPEIASHGYASPMVKAKSTAQAEARSDAVARPASTSEAEAGRKIVRTSSLQIVVQHPSEAVERITALAKSLGGYLVNAEGGGEDATSATLTIRVPAKQYERVQAELRKLGLRVESETMAAQDVTQQYVDQDANIRNLHAEEAQYLTILREAKTVKDMLAVSDKLSEVRGEIEQRQAEFNALSQQIDTVAVTIALHAEPPQQTFGLNWRPGYEIRIALRDGLESLASYGTAMLAVLFYLPSLLLWTGTILLAIITGWRIVRWVGRRWFGWTPERA